jgi:hypothetical protein
MVIVLYLELVALKEQAQKRKQAHPYDRHTFKNQEIRIHGIHALNKRHVYNAKYNPD